MSRSLVFLRDALPADAAILAELWTDVLRRGDEAERVADLVRIVETAGQDPDQRLVVAEYDGRLAGGVHLRLTTVSPLNLDTSVQVMSPQVFPEFRRHGVGRALMDAAVELGRGARRGSPRDRRRVGLARRQPLHGTARPRPRGGPAPGADHRRPRQADGPAPTRRPGARTAADARARRTSLDAPPGGRERLALRRDRSRPVASHLLRPRPGPARLRPAPRCLQRARG